MTNLRVSQKNSQKNLRSPFLKTSLKVSNKQQQSSWVRGKAAERAPSVVQVCRVCWKLRVQQEHGMEPAVFQAPH